MVIKVIIDTRVSNKEGKYPIKLRFSNLGKKVYSPLDIFTYEHEFDKNNQILYLTDKKTRNEYTKYNSYIIKELTRAQNLLHTLKMEGKDRIIPNKFKELFLKSQENIIEFTFNSYFKEFINKKEGRTKQIYQETLNKIQKYFGNNIYFDDVTNKWLLSFDTFMKKEGLQVNTRSIHMRNIRAIFNDAINNDIIEQGLYPFRKFKIETRKESNTHPLSVNQIRQIINYSSPTEVLEITKDIFLITFYLIGINVTDLYYLQKGEKCRYIRRKTHKNYDIEIHPELQKLIEKYKDETRMFNFYKRWTSYNSFKSQINRKLKEIGEEIGEPNLILYHARHSWASIAYSLDISKDDIGEALGHSNKNVTDIYARYDRKRIDIANRKVIDYVLI